MSTDADNREGERIVLAGLNPEIRAALHRCAEGNGRTIHEEVERILRMHLASCGDGND